MKLGPEGNCGRRKQVEVAIYALECYKQAHRCNPSLWYAQTKSGIEQSKMKNAVLTKELRGGDAGVGWVTHGHAQYANHSADTGMTLPGGKYK
jgi:hypothetical protein